MSDNADNHADNPMDKLPAHNRVSIRAVLVHEGEDPSAALAEAGFADAVAIPVVLGEQPDLPGGILGNGSTPNLTAVLEAEQEDAQDIQPVVRLPVVQRSAIPSDPDPARSSGPVTTTLPPAYGMQPLAPVRKITDAGQRPSAEAAFHGDRAAADPPPPGRFAQVDPTGTDGGMDPHAPMGNDRPSLSDPSGTGR